MKSGRFIGVLLVSTALAAPVLAQTRQPAQITTLPNASPPQEFDLLDKAGAWQRLGYVGANAGAVFSADQYGTVKGDFVNDDGPAIVAAISAAAVGGGTVVLLNHPYWNKTQAIVVPVGVRLTCVGAFNKRRLNTPGYQNMPCTIYENVAGGASFKVYGAATDIGVLNDAAHTHPTTTTRPQMAALIAAFSGTGVLVGDNDGGFTGTQAIIRNVLVGGFATCIKQNGATQVQIQQTLGDCTNGYDLAGSFDNNFLQDMEFWSFLTTSIPTGTAIWNITAMADNGSGAWRLTIASSADPPQTGEQLWVFPGGGSLTGGGTIVNAPGGTGAQGLWTLTAIDATHVDLQGSATAPTTTGNTNANRTYIAVASTANLAAGMNVTGAGVPAGATIAAVWRSRAAISLDQAHPATATATGVALSFANTAYSGSGGSVRFEKNVRSGTGFAIGHADGTTCSGCFAYGYLTGFNFRSGAFNSFTNSQIDGPSTMAANQNVVPVGVEFTGDVSGTYFQTTAVNTQSIHILNNTVTSTPGGQNVIRWTVAGGASLYNSTYLENVSGGINVSGPSASYGGAFLLDDTAAVLPVFMGVNTPNARIYSTGGLPRFYGAANLFGGNLDQQVPVSHKAQTFIAAGSVSANYNLYDASRPLDEKWWRLQSGNGSLCFQPMDDTGTATSGSALCASRSGNAPGAVSVGVDLTVAKSITAGSSSIASLPACTTTNRGAVMVVTNGQTTPPYLGAVSTTGSTVAPVFCNGSGWIYH